MRTKKTSIYKGKTYKSGELTRQIVIDTAGCLAGKHSFHSISTRMIADACKVNIGSIHYHFGSKSNLFKAVIDDSINDFIEFSAEKALKPYSDIMDSPEGQAKAIRVLIHRQIHMLFNENKPDWHAKIVYQLLQTKSELQDYLKERFLDNDIKSTLNVIRLILPGVSHDEALMLSIILNTPIFFHALNMEFILELLDKSAYSSAYLERLEDVVVQQALLLLGLPLDKQFNLRKQYMK